MDDRDEYEPEAEVPMEPVTERVRIIGAQPAGAAGQAGRRTEEPEPADVPGPTRSRASMPPCATVPSAPTFDLFSDEPEFPRRSRRSSCIERVRRS